jgi:ATP-dependent RNA helicase RhlE
VHLVDKAAKARLLSEILSDPKVESALVFTRTKRGADRVAKRLGQDGIRAEAIHGNKSQNVRERTLDNFRSRRTRVLVAPDLAARGIDVDGITHVVNYELPNVPESYVHRIGRTGRAGATGIAISLCDAEERPLLRDIEKLLRRELPKVGSTRGSPARAETSRPSNHAPRRHAAAAVASFQARPAAAVHASKPLTKRTHEVDTRFGEGLDDGEKPHERPHRRSHADSAASAPVNHGRAHSGAASAGKAAGSGQQRKSTHGGRKPVGNAHSGSYGRGRSRRSAGRG